MKTLTDFEHQNQERLNALVESISWQDTLLKTIDTLASLQKELIRYLAHDKPDIQNLTSRIAESEILFALIKEMRGVPVSVEEKKELFVNKLYEKAVG